MSILHHTMERRRLEVFFATLTLGFGAFLLMPVESMDTPAMAHLTKTMDEAHWGGLFLVNGAMHCVWLAVNGARWWSPIVRYGAAFGSMVLYMYWAAGVAYVDSGSTAVYTYSALSVGAAMCCVFAWRDALTAIRVRRAQFGYT